MKHGRGSEVFETLANTSADGGVTGCGGGNCPTVYGFSGDELLIQGFEAGHHFEGSFIPDGETVVRIPKALLRQLVERNAI